MLYKLVMDSPIGKLSIVTNPTHLVAVHMENEYDKAANIPAGDVDILFKTKAFFDAYFKGEHPVFERQLIALEGTDFQKEVWELLLAIPYGQTTTYKALAAQIAKNRNIEKMSAQAVGGAVGSNPISIIVPCHRVIGSNQHLTGFGGGMERKIKLLNHEGLTIKDLKVIKK
ncbi:MAG: methylated-DNA--[protein]-cysteine S-methyltransferase [Erysipelothrix sp.]|nr:methylated-DNA--[protein]-cysteine S-methyltransferase [Erysipelothrix sp.]